MKRFAIILLMSMMLGGASWAKSYKADKAFLRDGIHRVMTANIRVTGLPADEQPGLRWDDRKDLMISLMRKYNPDIIQMQEVIYDSYLYCKQQLHDYFAFGFEGPEMDPYTEGYHLIAKNVIFFRKSRYEFISAGCYWLSDQPTIGGSISWQSMRARHCNWVRIRDKVSGKEFRLLDIHLDHKVNEAKVEQAKMIVKEADQYDKDFVQILCGDFNSRKWQDPVMVFTQSTWTDVYDKLHNGVEFGPTAHAFKGPEYKPKNPKNVGRIDFIMTKGPVKALQCEVITDKPNNIWPSDHYFLYSDLQF